MLMFLFLSASYNRVCCKGPGMTCGGEGKERLLDMGSDYCVSILVPRVGLSLLAGEAWHVSEVHYLIS